MAHLDLVWPAIVLVVSIAGAIVVRIVATQGDRASRARGRRRIEDLRRSEVWQGSRGGDRDAGTAAATIDDGSAEDRGR